MADTNFVDGTSTVPGTPLVAAWHNDVNTATYDRLTAVAGTNTITATGPSSMTAYAAGQNFYLIPAITNTGAVTLNVSSLGAKAVTKNGTTPLVASDMVAGTMYEVSYDGTQFQLINPSTFNTTQSVPAANITGQVAIANGGTGASTAANARTNLGATTIGNTVFTSATSNDALKALEASRPAMRAYLGSGTPAVTAGSLTPFIMNNVQFDVTSAFNTTNGRFTPLVAGYYLVTLTVALTLPAASGAIFPVVQKNGASEELRGNRIATAGAGSFGVTVSGLVFMNGTTDYILPVIFSASAGTLDNGANNTTMSAFLAHAT